jgi:uncharacterized protein YukE
MSREGREGMQDFAVTPGVLDTTAGICLTEADAALNTIDQFKAYLQSLQSAYQPVSPDVFAKMLDDFEICAQEYCRSLAGMGSGLRRNYANYSDIEQLNTKLVSIGHFNPVTYDVDATLPPAGTPQTPVPSPDTAGTDNSAAVAGGGSPPPSGSGAPPQVDAWISQAIRVMEDSGIPASQLNPQDLWIIIQYESGGDPTAINTWDSNAAMGTPSTGMMQTIAPTFNAYALPGHNDIMNPVDNIIAGTRYALDRYGSLDNVPGVLAVHNGQPYVPY